MAYRGTCNRCGAEIPMAATYCPDCGVEAPFSESPGKTREELYRERNAMWLALVRAGVTVGAQVYLTDTGDGWPVAGAFLPTGQVGAHVPRELVDEHVSWLPERPVEWDGHDYEDRIDRLLDYAGDCPSRVSLNYDHHLQLDDPE